MKPSNFPARKLARQLRVMLKSGQVSTDESVKQLQEARKIRSKKDRRGNARVSV